MLCEEVTKPEPNHLRLPRTPPARLQGRPPAHPAKAHWANYAKTGSFGGGNGSPAGWTSGNPRDGAFETHLQTHGG